MVAKKNQGKEMGKKQEIHSLTENKKAVDSNLFWFIPG